MKFLVSSGELKKALQPLRISVNASTVLPVLEDVLVRVDSEKKIATFQVSNLELFMSVTVAIEAKESFSFLVNYKDFIDFFRLINDQPVTLELTKDKKLVLTAATEENDDVRVVLDAGDSVDNFPKEPNPQTEKFCFEWEHKKINTILTNTLPFISHDDLRPAMTGACICAYKGKLHIVATDAHKLYFQNMEEPYPEAQEAIISMQGVRAMIELSKPVNGHMSFRIFDNGHAVVKTGEYTLDLRLVDARFPDWRVVIPEGKGEVCFKRKQFSSLIKIAERYSNKSTKQMVLGIDDNKAEINGGDLDFSTEFKYKMPVYNIGGEPLDFRIAFNARFMQQILATSKDEYMKFKHCGSPTRALLIDDYILLMPLMLNQ